MAYPRELRQRVLDKDEDGLTQLEIAEELSVSQSWVNKILKIYALYGELFVRGAPQLSILRKSLLAHVRFGGNSCLFRTRRQERARRCFRNPLEKRLPFPFDIRHTRFKILILFRLSKQQGRTIELRRKNSCSGESGNYFA